MTTQERIKDDAKKAYPVSWQYQERIGYIAGATAENEHNESLKLQLEAQNANVEILLQQKKDLIEKSQVLVDALGICKHALELCYDVTEHPADGSTAQDSALIIIAKALEQWKSGKGKEVPKPAKIETCGHCGTQPANNYIGNQLYLCDECMEKHTEDCY